MKKNFLFIIAAMFSLASKAQNENTWIRINQMGYIPGGIKVAVWCSKENKMLTTFQLVDVATKKFVYTGSAGKPFGKYGPFTQTYRLNFSKVTKPGRYYLQAEGAKSPEFKIEADVYKGAADFCLRYMRQQRSGFNPFLKDSCHTHDGYTLYGEAAGIKDSTYFDVSGGWHDASDYLQYATTSANAAYHLLMASRDFPKVFSDEKMANGLDGKNNIPDVLDEAKWGLDWLLKMHPSADIMFNQIADDRDHQGMRIPKEDSFYGRGYERPVYFINGEPQQRGKFMNNTTGTSSTAAKFSSAFILGNQLFKNIDKPYSELLKSKAVTALNYAKKNLGVTQTVSVRSPYIYAEDNWVDDLELAFALTKNIFKEERKENDIGIKITPQIKNGKSSTDSSLYYARQEPITPWLGKDTANHYQWYPFINLGHYELAKQLKGNQKDTIVGYYKEGIKRVWDKAKKNVFYRGVPFIWCSNNLTTSFAIQCYWYRQLSKDNLFAELEQANIDWLFGCNPWGTSMVYGLPSWGDTPADPHSAFTHLKNYPIDGGLIDGPVYGSIYKNLTGITLYQPDAYAPFQSDLAVYHDDYGDYSTNEPTMDGTASLIYLLAAASSKSPPGEEALDRRFLHSRGAIIRGDSTQKKISIIFSGDEFAEGGNEVFQTLKQQDVKASFFFTGNFYRNPLFKKLVLRLKRDGHYLGAHSDKHLLYCDWEKRDSLLVTKEQFEKDVINNYKEMRSFGIQKKDAHYFLPPYEWYNDSIAAWAKEMGFQLINFTPGTLSNADYTTIRDKNYRSSEKIYQSIIDYNQKSPNGLNGFILLMHAGAGPERTDKFYKRLPQLLERLKRKHCKIVTIDELLK